MNTRYSIMKNSEVYKDDFGNEYKDVFSFPINDFSASESVISYTLTSLDIYRFDLLVYRIYNDANYDDFVLWYNNIENIKRLKPGTVILFPAKVDIDNFYREKNVWSFKIIMI